MSSFDIAAIISELKPIITDAWINNIYHLDSIFTIKFRTKTGIVELLIEPQKRIHLTKYKRPKPKYPSKFCMTLRKYLRNQRVLEIKQHQFDRVVIIKIGRLESQNKLIIEFFERGNLVLLDSEGRVLIALNYRTMRDRRIIPKREFNFAPSRGIDIKKLTIYDLKTILRNKNQDLIRALVANINISPLYAEELCSRALLDKKVQSSELNDEDITKLFESIKNLISILQNKKFNPNIFQIDSKSCLSPIELYQSSSFKKQKYDNFNDAADEFFSSKEDIKTKIIELKDKKTELSKTEKILQNQQAAIRELKQNSVRFKQLGDILYRNFQEIEELLTNIKKARNNGRSWEDINKIIKEAKKKNISPVQIIKSINYKNASLILQIEENEFPIDFRKSVAENANIFYTKSKKAAKKLDGAKKAYQQILKQKNKVELEAELINHRKEKKLIEKRKKYWYEKFHWFISSNDFLVIGGRDLKTNELIL
ncbi:MAG: ribosome rescue protein RqcH [Promethearchaeota archaeon]